MKYKYIILLSIVATLLCTVVGGWYFMQHTTTIYKTPWGYFPYQIEVPLRTTVTFKNMSKQYMWPASDLHPTHDAYSAFDSQGAIESGGTWSFTFQRRGVWTYHDHMAAQLTGRVVVYDETGSTVFDCEGADKKACWVADIEYALLEGGVRAAYDALLRIHDTYPEFASSCHNYGHDIGLKAFVYYGQEVDFGPETSYCNAGFYHGFVEGLIDRNTNIKEVEAFCERTGERLANSFPLAEQQCRHGIGHAAVEYYMTHHPELVQNPEELIGRALDMCRALDNVGDEHMRCASGVFNVYRDLLTATAGFDAMERGKETLAICTKFEEPYVREGCYWELAKIYSAGQYTQKILNALRDGVQLENPFVLDDVMAKEDHEQFLPQTTASWAMLLGKRAVNEHAPATILAVCDDVPNFVRTKCQRGLYDGAFTSSAPFEEYRIILPMCSNDHLDETEKQECFIRLQRNLHDNYGPEDRQKQCVFIPEEYFSTQYCGDTVVQS